MTQPVDYEELRTEALRMLKIYQQDPQDHDFRDGFGLFLIAHAEALLNPDPWRPIEEAPKDGKSVLLACDYDRHGKQRVSLAWWDDQFDKSEISGCWIEGWFYDYQEDENTPMRVEFRPTHWKPLPAPPEKGPGQ